MNIKPLVLGASMLLALPASLELCARGCFGVSPTELRESYSLAEKMNRPGIRAGLIKQLPRDNFDTLDRAIGQVAMTEQPYVWPFVEGRLGKFKGLPKDSAKKVFQQTLAEIKAKKAPDAFMIKALKEIDLLVSRSGNFLKNSLNSI